MIAFAITCMPRVSGFVVPHLHTSPRDSACSNGPVAGAYRPLISLFFALPFSFFP